MKTAEEWAAIYDAERFCKVRKFAFHNGDIIRAIQSDAYAQGMTDAAALIDFDLPSNSNYKKILSARDQKGKTE